MKKKVPLTVQYEIGQHVDNLRARFGEERMQRVKRYEDLAGPLDKDIAPILEFREAIDLRDRLKEKRGNIRARTVVMLKRDWLLKQFMQDKSINALAKELDVPAGSLRWYVQKDPELKRVYQMMSNRRKYISEATAVKIRKMLSEGYTHAVIIATLHVTPSQVEYQQSKRKAGLV